MYNWSMIRILLFASLRDAVGESSLEIEIDGETTPERIFESLAGRFPELERYRKFTSVAVNESYCDWSKPIEAGDEVAFFPPVSGGAG